jgi:GDSL-like lipase/acylhydrolase family protein
VSAPTLPPSATQPPAGSQPAARRKPSLRARLGLLLLGLLLPILLLELVLRIFGPVLPGDYQTAEFTVYSPQYERANRPNTQGWIKRAEFTQWVRINSQGLRGPELPYAKPPDTYRVMVLGDSFVFALHVTEAETVSSRLQELLNQGDPRPRIETINAGTEGWNTINELNWLADEGSKYQPDLVLLMFFVGNDPLHNAKETKANQDHAQQLGLAAARTPFDGLRAALRSVSVAYNVFEFGVLAKIKVDSEDFSDDETKTADNQTERKRLDGWEASELWLGRLRDYCAAHNQQLVVVGIPTIYEAVDSKLRTLPLRKISDRLGVQYVELLDAYQDQPDKVQKRLYFPRNLHWTAEGHALSAQIIATALRDRGLVPR